MIRKIVLSISFAIFWTSGFSQAPGHIPKGNPEPIELNLGNIILYIVIPVLLVIIYVLYRRSQNKKGN